MEITLLYVLFKIDLSYLWGSMTTVLRNSTNKYFSGGH